MQEQCALITLLDSVQDNGENPILTNPTGIDENSTLINSDVADEHSILIDSTINDTNAQCFIDPSLITQSSQDKNFEKSIITEQSEQIQKATQEEGTAQPRK